MNNIIFGILTITFCAIGYFFSYRYWTKDNYKIAILLLVICGLALRIYTSTDFFLHSWDERYHALVAKNLIQHPLTPTLYDSPVLPYDYKNWPANHIWLHKQPLPLWTMAASMSLFGVNEIALRLPSIIFTTIGIWLTFSIGSFFFNKKIGYWAAFLYSINGLIIEATGGRTGTGHTDIYFLFFIELAVFFSIIFVQKKKTIYNVLAGFSIGAAILSKWLPALIVLPIWLLIVIDSGYFKPRTIIFQFFILIMTCIAVFLPWQVYIFQKFPIEANWEATYNIRHITEVIEGHTGPFYYYFMKLRIYCGDLIYLPLLWFLWKTFRNRNNLKRLAITIWFLVPFLFFSISETKAPVYILFIAPTLFLMTSEFISVLTDYKKNHKLKWLFNLILILLIALPIRYTIERVKPFEKRDRKPQWITDLKKLNDRKIQKGLLFNFQHPIEAMFYTNLTVYPDIPDKNVINGFIEKGYTVLFNNNTSNVPDEILAIKGVSVENINDDDY